jgi:hypothetical protein
MERASSLQKKAWVGLAYRGEVWTDVVIQSRVSGPVRYEAATELTKAVASLHILKSKLLVAYRLLLDPIHDALAYARSWAHTIALAHAQLSAHARARTRVAARTRNHAMCCRFTKRVGVGWAVIRRGSDLTPRG